MSAFSELFGGAKTDESLVSLLNKAGPVQRMDVRARTVVEVPEPKKPKKERKRERKAREEKESGKEEEGKDSKEEEKEANEEKVSEEEKAEGDEQSEDESPESKDSDNEDLEANYFSKTLGTDKDDEKEESEQPKERRRERATAAKSVDLKEEELQKAERTVFVGNVSNKVLSSKTSYKEFKKLFQNLGEIKSIRFRSIAFDEALPRKIAFARKSLHDSRDTLNAYVVFAEKEASLKAAGKLNATVFDHNHLRVDHVAHPSPRDNKRTIFVGNLDFEEREEKLWRYFNKHVDDDVVSVRVVRDAKTNVGKGFALVQFGDSLSVNKALLLNGKPLDPEDKKSRKLRVSRANSHAKPSVISPNHYDNQKKGRKPRVELTDDQKTKVGRAKKLLGKADRTNAGTLVVEGTRATKGQKIAGIKGLKSAQGKVKKPRITKRSKQFKEDREQFSKIT